MAELKTQENDADVKKFINSVKDKQKREDSLKLLEIFTEVTKKEGKMWGSSIIGFGKYHYQSKRSKQEGDWPLTGFSPRKQAITIYIMFGFEGLEKTLKQLGKYKLSSGSCIYINKLDDVNLDVLKELIRESFKRHPKSNDNLVITQVDN